MPEPRQATPAAGKPRVKIEKLPAGQRVRIERVPSEAAAPAASPGFWGHVSEIPEQVAGGVLEALRQAGKTGQRLYTGTWEALGVEDPTGFRRFAEGVTGQQGAPAAAHIPGQMLETGRQAIPSVAEPETTTGGITRGVSQFLAGFAPAFRLMRAAGLGSGATTLARMAGAGPRAARIVGTAAQGEAAAQLADQVVFDPFEQRLSNLIESYPSLRNPVTAYLQADTEDPEALARFKVGLEGAGLGAATAGMVEAVRLLARARRYAASAARSPVPQPSAAAPGTPGAAPPAAAPVSQAAPSQAAPAPAGPAVTATPAAAPAVPVDEFAPVKRTGRQVPADNFLGPLSRYSPVMFRETSADNVEEFLPVGRMSSNTATDLGVFMADTPDLALGQGNNRGLLMAFDAAPWQGRINTGLPGWQEAFRRGGAEYMGRVPSQQAAKDSLRALRVFDRRPKPSRAFEERLKGTLRELEASGWVRRPGDGFTDYLRPDVAQGTGSPMPSATPGGRPAIVEELPEGAAYPTKDQARFAIEATTTEPPPAPRVQPQRPMTEADLQRQSQEMSALGMRGEDPDFLRAVEVIQGKRRAPRRPETLTGWLRRTGGVQDAGGELRHIGLTSRAMPGLIRQQGRTLDEAAEGAWEAGFFGVGPGRVGEEGIASPRPTVQEFLAALADDYSGAAPRFGYGSEDAQRFYQTLDILDERASAAEVDLSQMSTPDAVRFLTGQEVPTTPRTLEDMEREAAELATAGASYGESRGKPAPDLAGNVNLRNVYTGEDAKRLIRDTAEQYGARMQEARRGVQSDAQTRALASDLGMTPADLLKRRKGQAFNAEEALAARRIMATSARQVADLAKRAKGGSDADLVAFQEAWTRHVALQEQVAGATAEAGRALRQFRIPARTGAGLAEARLKQIVDAGGGRDTVEGIADKVDRLADALSGEPGSDAALNEFLRKARKPKLHNMLFELWINGLLSGLKTHVVNNLSNALTIGWTLPEHAAAATLGTARRAIGGGADRVYWRDVVARMQGMVDGVGDGLRAMAKTIRTGEPVLDPMSKLDMQRHQAIPGRVGRIVRIPGTALQSADELWKSIGFRAALRQRAMRQGLQAGYRGRRLAEHVEQRLRLPTDEDYAKALKEARKQTFTNPLGPVGQSVMTMANRVPLGRVVAPFIRTPGNIFAYSARRSPFGLLMREVREDLRRGGAPRDLAIARMGLGTGISAWAASLAAQGIITGGGPTDYRAQQQLRAQGWQPYSVKVGDTYYSYARFEPLSTLLGVAADFVELRDEMGETEADKVAALMAGSVIKNLSSKAFLQGPAEFAEFVSDPGRYGERYAKGLLGSVVPTGVAHVSQAIDPTFRSTYVGAPEAGEEDTLLRSARGMLNTIKERVPGYSSDLPPRRDIFGEVIVRSGALGPDILSPIFTSRARDNPAAAELMRVKVLPSKPRAEIGGVKLSSQQYDELQETSGRLLRQGVERLISAPEYQGMSRYFQREALRKIVNGTRRAARETLVSRYPELARKRQALKREEITGQPAKPAKPAGKVRVQRLPPKAPRPTPSAIPPGGP